MPDCKPISCSSPVGGITVSLVTYNNPPSEIESLLRALTSSHHVLRIIVVDNSPSDVLRECVQSTGAEYRQVPENIGFGSAHNLAMGDLIARSKYHLVVNPDIECTPATLDALYEFLEAHPTIGLAMPRVFFPNGREQHLCKLIPSALDLFLRRFVGTRGLPLFRNRLERYEMRHLDFSQPREVPYLSGCFMFLRCSALQEVGLFDPSFFMYLEDVDLCRRVGARFKTVFFPFASVTHGYSKGSYKNLRLLRYHLVSAVRYFNKWGWVRDPLRKALNTRTSLFP